MALVHSVLMAAIGGMRAMTPLAAVANAARDGLLPRDNGAPDWLSSRATSAATGALAPARQRNAAALLGAAAAIGSSYATFRMRKYALRRYGQTPTGVVEDGISAAGAALVVAGVGRTRRGR